MDDFDFIVPLVIGLVGGLIAIIIKAVSKESAEQRELEQQAWIKNEVSAKMVEHERESEQRLSELGGLKQIAENEARKRFPEGMPYDEFFANMTELGQMRTYF